MNRKAFACVSLAFVFALVAAGAGAQSKKLSLDTYLDWEEVQDPQISPDSTQILFTRRWIDKVNDRWESALWIMNADGTKQRFLVKGASARWAPEGARIAYLAEGEPKGQQVFVRWMDAEGAVTQITRTEKTPGSPVWSLDGNSIAFTMLVPKKDTWTIKLPARPEGAKWTRDPRIIERFVYRADRVGFLDEGYRQIFLVPATGGTPRQLTSGDFEHPGASADALSWTPDGREVLFSGLRQDDWEYQLEESQIYAVNVKDGAVRQLTTRRGVNASPAVSPDGKQVAYISHEATDDTHFDSPLYVMGIDGSNPRALTPNLDRTPLQLHWAADGGGIYFTCEDRGSRNLHLATLGGEVRQITQGAQILSVTSIARNGQVAATLSNAQKPPDVVTFSTANPAPRQLTAVNDDVLAGVKLGDVEEIWYTSVDNFRIQGWIIKPPDFDAKKKYPLMLSIHGGPHAMYGVGFNFGWQEHAANGYVVLYTNPRGSTGYGSAFGNAIKNAYPSKDFDDLMKGVDEIVAKGYIDTQNLFVYGCSGGGVLTAWTVGHTNRFAAASSNCPVINWTSFAGTTDINLWGYHRFNKLPWEDPLLSWQHSPLASVGNVKTPTMLMTGELDLRTPIPQTEEFYEALKLRKVPTAMVRFAEEYHGTSSKPSNYLRTQLYLRYWFSKYARK